MSEYLYCQSCGNYLGCSTGVSPKCACCGWRQPVNEDEAADDEQEQES